VIIDAHAHIDESKIRGWVDPAERVIKFMDMANIDIAVVSTYRNAPTPEDESPLEYLIQETNKFPDRLIPFVRLNPRYGEATMRTLVHAVENMGYKGVKLHPASYNLYPGGQATVDLFRKAAEYDIPVLVHCADEIMCLPLQFAETLEQSPDTKVILAHMGGFFHKEDAIKVCKRFPNIYMDTCEFPFVDGIKRAVEELGPERILFGTDNPIDNPLFEIEKIKEANLGREAEEKIFFKNAAKLLKLEVKGELPW